MAKGITMEAVITELERFYTEYGRSRPMEYTYGFMDALRVVRDMGEDTLYDRLRAANY